MKFTPALAIHGLLVGSTLAGSIHFGDHDSYGQKHLTTNGVGVGWLPSNGNATEGVESPRYTMKEINAKLGAVSSYYGMYSHITGDTYDGYELLEEFDDVVSSGAVFVASVMPVLAAGFTGITPGLAHQIAAVMRKFTDRGVHVWLRFGHEMNWYVDPAAEPRYYGTPAEFIAAWNNVARAVSDNDKVSMFWSPNNIGNGAADVLDQWYPGDASVDLVGIDCYPQSTSQTFDYLYKNFYDRFSAGKNKPFAIGETGANSTMKEAWLKQLVSQRRTDYPNYIAMNWFEYLKEADFRLVEADQETLDQTKKTLGLGRRQ